MKTPEEIDKLAHELYPVEMVAIFTQRDRVDKNRERRKIFIEAYTHAQKDDEETIDEYKQYLRLLNEALKENNELKNKLDASYNQEGYLFEGRFYKSIDELKGTTFSEENKPKPIYSVI